MSTSEGDLLDVGVWVALSVAEHEDHRRATQYWRDEARLPVAFCRTTALGLVRLLGQKTGEAVEPLSLEESWDIYLRWKIDPAVRFASDPNGVEASLERLVRDSRLPKKLWTDAYLAAFAISAGLRLVSFDQDFERFPGLDLLRLSS